MVESSNQLTTLEIEDMITVGSLAEGLAIPVSKLIAELMKNGVMATVNERLDFDTAQIIVEELGLDVKLLRKQQEPKLSSRPKKDESTAGQTRPPVVAVMGHVDHGKTSLLDAIRGANVAKSEAGGITQHLAAYQIKYKNREITFLDTPGHEAFAALREHGAQLTDIVVIVVAADDGVKPQTIEAIRFAKKAGVKIIVAINKIDKEGADINKVKQQLSEHDLLVEEWGGDIVTVALSAKTKEGIDKLLDMIFLISDIEDLKAEFNVPASGLIIEAHFEQGRGPVAQALIERGTLKPGKFIVAGSTYAKVRNLETVDGQALSLATPSMPVVITGFKNLAEFGDEFSVVDNEKAAKIQANAYFNYHHGTMNKTDMGSNELIRLINRGKKLREVNILVKADVQGSLTSVLDSLKTLDSEEVATRIVASGIGPVNENDIYLAHTSNAIIYGFNVSLPSASRQLASRDKVKVRLFKVIYELLDDIKSEMSNLLSPEIIETDLGRLIVKAVFKTTKSEIICGGEVSKGKLTVPSIAKISRGNELIAEVEATQLRRGPTEVSEVLEGEMCGLSLKTTKKLELNEGDRVDLFKREEVQRQLK